MYFFPPLSVELGQTQMTDDAFLILPDSPALFYILNLGHESVAINGYTATNF